MTPVAGEIEILPVRHVAARFVARVEQDGLDELDADTSALFGRIRIPYLLWLIGISVGGVFFIGAVAVSFLAALARPTGSNAPVAVALSFALIWIAVLTSWR